MIHVRIAAIAIAVCLSLFSVDNLCADLVDRWTQTATNPSLNRGDAATITWSIVGDGTTISGSEGTSGSNLIQFLDTHIGAGDGGSDLTNRPWFTSFEQSFDRWAAVTGITYIYEANDDNQTINNFSNPRGELGVRGDVRIGGHSIDGQSGSNTLAYNYFPDHGDMVIDTDNINFYRNANSNYRRLRNVLMHEAGHGIGLAHVRSNDAAFLMEPSINTNFDGPQFDDIWSAQSGYGDVHEKNGGNDTAGDATSLGAVADGATVSIGDDAGDAVVSNSDIDFIGIDGVSDIDFLSFDIGQFGLIDVLLNPMGPTYDKSGSFNASAQSDLMLEIFDTDGTTSLGFANNTGLGGSESLSNISVGPGTYYAKISGTQDANQLYQFQSSFTAVPEPSSVAGLGLIAVTAMAWRIRRRRIAGRKLA